MKVGRRILIVGPSWVGDMVMAQTLFSALKQQHPDCSIDVLALAWSRPILERMPEVADTIDMPVGHGALDLSSRLRVARLLRQKRYDQAIVLPNSLKSGLIPWLAGIPLRTGWRGEMRYFLLNDIRLLDKERYPLMVQRFVALALPADAPPPEDINRPNLVFDPEIARSVRQKLDLVDARPILALCPGAEFGPAKRWPEQYYGEVAAARIDAGWQVWLMGSANDREVTAKIAGALTDQQRRHCHDLAGRTALAEAIDLLGSADAVVSNDSGLMHIAAALNRPMAVLYGSTSPKFTPPLSDQVAILNIPVDCGPCFQRQCPLGHLKCLWGVPPDRVLAALQGFEAEPLAVVKPPAPTAD